MQEKMIVVEIVDETIDFPIEAASSTCKIHRIKKWAAVVARDKRRPGGLDRAFLKSREDGEIVLIEKVQAGDFIEFRCQVVTYAKTGGSQQSLFWKILSRTNNELIVNEVSIEEIPSAAEQEDLGSEHENVMLQSLKNEILTLRSDLEQRDKCLKIAKTTSNRIHQKLKENKLTEDILRDELAVLRHALLLQDQPEECDVT